MTLQFLSEERATEILRQVWPDVVVTEVCPRTGGQLSSVYEVRCSQPADAVIVKVYADQWRWKQAKEVSVYRLLSAYEVGPVPVILRVEPDTALFGYACTAMTMLPGVPLSHVSADLDTAQVARVYRQLGATLAAIHRIGQSSYGYLTTRILDPEPDNTAYMTRQFAKKLAEFEELGGDLELHTGIRNYVAKRTDLFRRCEAPVLCHNDFHEGNVLVEHRVDGWKVSGFIDVENAVAADPLLDLAKTDYYAVQGDPVKRTALVDGYGPLPADWAARSALYRLYHALELWDWFAAIGEGALLAGIAEDIRRMV
ncbi:phosphotransferase family protein [Nocardia suismassiliense]|uniref:phosphotransferase family protein n=1 Tax=Nocardia suismassiliense TaxID=2077092 RepID=UPI0018FE808F|nr:aminoglycoside phosphotransferase family protein [Nocardia suismassiliense]